MFEIDDTIQFRSQNQQEASLVLYETSSSPRASHPIGAWPRQPAYFEPPPTSGSLHLLSVPMDRNRLDAETQSHLIFSSAGDVCPWRLLPQPGLGPERLVCLFKSGARRKIDPVVTAGRCGRLDGERKVRRRGVYPERPASSSVSDLRRASSGEVSSEA